MRLGRHVLRMRFMQPQVITKYAGDQGADAAEASGAPALQSGARHHCKTVVAISTAMHAVSTTGDQLCLSALNSPWDVLTGPNLSS